MHPRYTAEAEAYREKIQAFLAEHLPPDWRGLGALDPEAGTGFVADWRRILADHDLLAVAWPKEYGGAGLSLIERTVLAEELAKAGVPAGNDNDGFSISMLGHTLLQWGTEEQKRHFLPRILSRRGRVVPGLLASRTRARTWPRWAPGPCATATSG